MVTESYTFWFRPASNCFSHLPGALEARSAAPAMILWYRRYRPPSHSGMCIIDQTGKHSA